jgi:hypothetical protein
MSLYPRALLPAAKALLQHIRETGEVPKEGLRKFLDDEKPEVPMEPARELEKEESGDGDGDGDGEEVDPEKTLPPEEALPEIIEEPAVDEVKETELTDKLAEPEVLPRPDSRATKAELLEFAKANNLNVSDDMLKADLWAAIEEAKL